MEEGKVLIGPIKLNLLIVVETINIGGDLREEDSKVADHLKEDSNHKAEAVLCLLEDATTIIRWYILWEDVLRGLLHHPWGKGEHN